MGLKVVRHDGGHRLDGEGPFTDLATATSRTWAREGSRQGRFGAMRSTS